MVNMSILKYHRNLRGILSKNVLNMQTRLIQNSNEKAVEFKE